ncbi:hypothetical protein J6TS2_25650 [Heyndrickxia sporothermodurans]|nr:hypothetical protein J6TS2_25650 [Heyndrickxia sporothermodurans]
MEETKYIVSNGIAFLEKKDLKMLRKQAANGWIVKRYKKLGYELEKGKPEDVTFSIDIRKLKEEELDEYIELFESAGWTHICSQHDMHLFKALPGTKPIYTDKESKVEKLERLQKSVGPAAAMTSCAMVGSYIVHEITSGTLSDVFNVIFLISIVVAVPMIATFLATIYHSIKVKMANK